MVTIGTALSGAPVSLSPTSELWDRTAAFVPHWGPQNFCWGPEAPSAQCAPARKASLLHLTNQDVADASLPAGLRFLCSPAPTPRPPT